MEFTELLRRRLKIANTAAQNDDSNSETVKAVLSVAVECLFQQANNLEIIQAEMVDKIGLGEFKQSMGQKLSLRQFLGYFQKVERIVQKMQAHWSASESRTQQLLGQKMCSLSNEMHQLMKAKMQTLSQQKAKDQSTLQSVKEDIDCLRQSLQFFKTGYEETINEFQQQLAERCLKTEQVLKSLPSNEKVSSILSEVKQMEVYLAQNHQELSQLMKSLAQGGMKDSFGLKDLELQKKIKECQNMTKQIESSMSNKWLWQWRSSTAQLQAEELNFRQALQFQSVGQGRAGIHILSSGFYRMTVGYLLTSSASGDLVFSVQQRQIYSLSISSHPQTGVCRSSMLYCYLSQGSTLFFSIFSPSDLTGFFQLSLI